MREVAIDRESVELCKLLKFEDLVASGGDAKRVIADGLVKVNGVVETRKRCKLRSGDVVEFGEERLRIVGGETA